MPSSLVDLLRDESVPGLHARLAPQCKITFNTNGEPVRIFRDDNFDHHGNVVINTGWSFPVDQFRSKFCQCEHNLCGLRFRSKQALALHLIFYPLHRSRHDNAPGTMPNTSLMTSRIEDEARHACCESAKEHITRYEAVGLTAYLGPDFDDLPPRYGELPIQGDHSTLYSIAPYEYIKLGPVPDRMPNPLPFFCETVF